MVPTLPLLDLGLAGEVSPTGGSGALPGRTSATGPEDDAGATVLSPEGAASPGRSGAVGVGSLLGRLRSPLSVRPAVDRGLAGGLRAWLEDGVAGATGNGAVEIRPGPGGSPALSPAHERSVAGGRSGTPTSPGRPAAGTAGGSLSVRELRTALLRTVFRLSATSGPLRAPFEDALSALAVEEDGAAVVRAVQLLGRYRRAQLREVVRHAAGTIALQWRPVPAAWLPRTAERLVAPLAGGRVVLRSNADLVLGGPSTGRASVCAVRAHGGPVADDGPNRRLLALLETLRSGAAPFRVASYDLDRGRLTVDDVTDDHLTQAVRAVLALTLHDAAGTAAP